MTLTKRKGIYYASVKGKGGRTKLISTGCSDRNEALKVVAESGVTDMAVEKDCSVSTQNGR